VSAIMAVSDLRSVYHLSQVCTLFNASAQRFLGGKVTTVYRNLNPTVDLQIVGMVADDLELSLYAVVGDLFYNKHSVLKLTLAGTSVSSTAANLAFPNKQSSARGIARDPSNRLLLISTSDACITKTPMNDQSGTVSLVLDGSKFHEFGNGKATELPGIAFSELNGNLYVATGSNQILQISSSGVVSPFAGESVAGSSDGHGKNARFNGPVGLVISPEGSIFVADQYNNRIRKISANGNVTTYAGSGAQGNLDGPALSATFCQPNQLALDPKDGSLFVADGYSQLVRKISASGRVTTVAGTATEKFDDHSVDGNVHIARFTFVKSLAVLGNTLYVGDKTRIRALSLEHVA